MFNWLKKNKTVKQPSIWAVRDSSSMTWHKVVSYERPTAMFSWYLVGKFRSEVDCEEYCDRANIALCNKVKFYKSSDIGDISYETEDE